MKKCVRLVFLIAFAVITCTPVYAEINEQALSNDAARAASKDSDAKFFDDVMKLLCKDEPVPRGEQFGPVYDRATGQCIPFKVPVVEW